MNSFYVTIEAFANGVAINRRLVNFFIMVLRKNLFGRLAFVVRNFRRFKDRFIIYL